MIDLGDLAGQNAVLDAVMEQIKAQDAAFDAAMKQAEAQGEAIDALFKEIAASRGLQVGGQHTPPTTARHGGRCTGCQGRDQRERPGGVEEP